MRVLLDTHVLLWAAGEPERLSPHARSYLDDLSLTLMFSAASIWEVSIKAAVSRDDFTVSASVLRRGLLEAGYVELAISAAHAAAVTDLPPVHRDPFDRMLVAQSRAEGALLLTHDKKITEYGGPIELV